MLREMHVKMKIRCFLMIIIWEKFNKPNNTNLGKVVAHSEYLHIGDLVSNYIMALESNLTVFSKCGYSHPAWPSNGL